MISLFFLNLVLGVLVISTLDNDVLQSISNSFDTYSLIKFNAASKNFKKISHDAYTNQKKIYELCGFSAFKLTNPAISKFAVNFDPNLKYSPTTLLDLDHLSLSCTEYLSRHWKDYSSIKTVGVVSNHSISEIITHFNSSQKTLKLDFVHIVFLTLM